MVQSIWLEINIPIYEVNKIMNCIQSSFENACIFIGEEHFINIDENLNLIEKLKEYSVDIYYKDGEIDCIIDNLLEKTNLLESKDSFCRGIVEGNIVRNNNIAYLIHFCHKFKLKYLTSKESWFFGRDIYSSPIYGTIRQWFSFLVLVEIRKKLHIEHIETKFDFSDTELKGEFESFWRIKG